MSRRRRKSSSADLISLTIGCLFLGVVACGLSPYWPIMLLPALLFLGLPVLLLALRVSAGWRQVRRYQALRLDDVDRMPGREFEHYVARLLDHQGFKTTVTKGSGDLGVDVIAQRDGQSYCVQCKRYSDNIPRTAISDAVAGMQHYRCTQAMVVTNRYFTAGALELARSTQCILIDRNVLASWVQNFQRQQTPQPPIAAAGGRG
jgi:HJR/Mrr/RecB family endonuclease